MPESALWFTIVFLVLLKIPLAYLIYVVWWAVKDPPVPGEGAAGAGGAAVDGPEPGSSWRSRSRRRPLRRGPHGSPARRPSPFLTHARSKTQP
jgi:hypothetical protein